MHRELKLKALRRALEQNEEIIKRDEVVFFCPRHGHKKPKLSVNLNTDKFHCWFCNWGGENLIGILRLKGATDDLRAYKEYIGEAKNTSVVTEMLYDAPVLPSEFVPLSDESGGQYYNTAMSYLNGRNVTADDILLWKLGYCHSGEYKNRIIVPSYDNAGELNFFVGRSFYDSRLAYKHGNFCKDIIWNDCMIDWSQPVTITEGPFDAFVVGDNVTILQGTILGDKLLKKVVSSGVDIYLAMDTDAFKRQLKHIELFISYGVNCHYVDLGSKKDVGSMTKKEFTDRKNVARPISNRLDTLKMQVNV